MIGDYYSSLQLYINNGSGSRSSLFTVLHIPSFSKIYGVACADVDGDSHVDLVASESGLTTYTMLSSGISPYFSIENAFVVPFSFVGEVALVDIDGDGLLDIAGNDAICWLGELERCVEVYAPEHGTIGTCVVPMANGTTCDFVCDLGFRLTSRTTCVNRSVAAGTCVNPHVDDRHLSALTHWVDFSDYANETIDTMTSFRDKMANATSTQVLGRVRYSPNVQNGLGAIYFHDDGTTVQLTFDFCVSEAQNLVVIQKSLLCFEC